MTKTTLLALLSASVLAGCITAPMTAEEYRTAIRSHGSAYVESFEVKRPVTDVARSFRRKAAECLSYELTSTSKGTFGLGSSTRVYATAKPTMLHSGSKAELHLQIKLAGNMVKEPPDGGYFLVADAHGLGKDKTRIDLYSSVGAAITHAVRGWAQGDEAGCPDPIRTFER